MSLIYDPHIPTHNPFWQIVIIQVGVIQSTFIMCKIWPKIKQIKNPNVNLSYCKISIAILYMEVLSLIICSFCMELEAFSKYQLHQHCIVDPNEAICHLVLLKNTQINNITNLMPWMTISILMVQVAEWKSMRSIIIFQSKKNTTQALEEMLESKSAKVLVNQEKRFRSFIVSFLVIYTVYRFLYVFGYLENGTEE